MSRRTWIAALALAAGAGCSLGAVVHVNIAAAPGGDGTTWATAFNALDLGLGAAQSGDQVWVAQGIYSGPHFVPFSFTIKSGVSVYGGFAGTETSVDQAQPSVFLTVLKGVNQGDPASGRSVVFVQNSSATTINGFTIRDGFAPNWNNLKGGGGVLIDGGTVTISDCVFTNNTTYTNLSPGSNWGLGGAVCILGGAAVTLANSTFDTNYTHGWWAQDYGPIPKPGNGGAVYVEESTLTIAGSIFTNNRGGGSATRCAAGMLVGAGDAASGGAVYALDSNLSISGCTFTGNAGGSSQGYPCGYVDPLYPDVPVGGAAGDGGAIYLDGGNAGISRCIFVNNSAGQSDAGSGSGGAIFAAGPAVIDNCRFLGNSAGPGMASGDAGHGGAIASVSSISLANCTLLGNHAGVSAVWSPPGADGVGGAIYAAGATGVVNCTIASNTARGQGAGIRDVNIINSIVWANESILLGRSLDAQMIGGTAFYSIVEGWIPSALWDPTYRNFSGDPMFVNLAGPDGIAGTLDDDVRLKEYSPAIDSGNTYRVPKDVLDLNGNSDTTEPIPFDLAGAARIVNDPKVPDSGFGLPPVDRGAYEFAAPACPGDLNGNGQVDDVDFVIFAKAYDLLDCADVGMAAGCPADLNKDGLVDDGDFVRFVEAYDALVCP